MMNMKPKKMPMMPAMDKMPMMPAMDKMPKASAMGAAPKAPKMAKPIKSTDDLRNLYKKKFGK
mgnify:CR=1 FL=1